MKKILLPIDRSELSQQSFAFAKEYAENINSKLVIIYVIEMHSYSPAYNKIYTERAVSDKEVIEKEINEILDKAKNFFDGTEIDVDTEILWGSPEEEIIEYAEKNNFDFIVMNTHGMSASKRFVLGSVTSKVVKHATIPVMVIR